MMSINYVICILLVTVFIFIVAGCKISCNMKGGTSYRPITDYTSQDNTGTQKQSLGSSGCKPPCFPIEIVPNRPPWCAWKNPQGKIVNCPF